ncbi:MAG: hypothetical protein HOC74_12800 [Gemmatimonadetes bacterium]|nr:hypothetical protein [Gemmatimonadota bacterium]
MKATYQLAISAITFALFSLHPPAHAQTDMDLLAERLQENPATAEAIALYPEEIRHAVFAAAQYPKTLVKMANLQTKASAAFTRVVEQFPQGEQEQLWDLVRFPGLIEALITGGPKNDRQIEAILEDYPREIHRAARSLDGRAYDALAEIHRLNVGTEKFFARLIADNPPAVQQDFHTLLQVPEMLFLLNEDMATTIMLGEVYADNPNQLEERIAALGLAMARQNARAVHQGEQLSIDGAEESDPDFSGIYDYDAGRLPKGRENPGSISRVYDYDASLLEGPNESTETTVIYHERPYPYWYGYPHWYAGAYINWHITPRLALSWYPRGYYRPYPVYRPYPAHRRSRPVYRRPGSVYRRSESPKTPRTVDSQRTKKRRR